MTSDHKQDYVILSSRVTCFQLSITAHRLLFNFSGCFQFENFHNVKIFCLGCRLNHDLLPPKLGAGMCITVIIINQHRQDHYYSQFLNQQKHIFIIKKDSSHLHITLLWYIIQDKPQYTKNHHRKLNPNGTLITITLLWLPGNETVFVLINQAIKC